MARSPKKASASKAPRTTKRTKGTKAAAKKATPTKASKAKAARTSAAARDKTSGRAPSKPLKKKAPARKAPAKTAKASRPATGKRAAPPATRSKKVVAAKADATQKTAQVTPAKAAAPTKAAPPAEPPKPRKPQKPEVTPKMISKIRETLEEQRAALFREFSDLEEGSFSLSQSDMSGEASFDEEYADAGSYTFEREKDLSIGNNIRDLLEKVTHAIERIDRGTYGLCENCGDPINKDRLLALPYSSLCIRCKQREERTR